MHTKYIAHKFLGNTTYRSACWYSDKSHVELFALHPKLVRLAGCDIFSHPCTTATHSPAHAIKSKTNVLEVVSI